jgi:energy-coupling factor transporter ATP-binding protein EcfA2
MTDSASQLAVLRALRDAAIDPTQRTALDAAIAALAATLPPSATDADSPETTLTIAGNAQAGVVVGRDVHGGVQAGGTRNEALIQIFYTAAGITQPSAAQRELIADYLASLARRCDQLRLRGVVDWERKRGKAPGFTLSQVYITLAADAWVTLREGDPDALEQERAGHDPDEVLPQDALRVVPAHGLGGAALPQRRGRRGTARDDAEFAAALQRPLLLTEALSERHCVVLLGGPGSGKSTFLRHLAVALARAEADGPAIPGWDAGPLLPVFASLGGFAAWLQHHPGTAPNAAALWRYLLDLSEHETLAGLGDELQRAFRRGRLLLLLDGLDEVVDPTMRAAVAQAVATLADRHVALWRSHAARARSSAQSRHPSPNGATRSRSRRSRSGRSPTLYAAGTRAARRVVR